MLGSAGGFMRYTNAESFAKAYQNGTGGAFITTRNTSFTNVRTNQYQYNGFLEYNNDFGQHHITALAGGEFFESRAYSYSASGRGAATDFIPYLSAATEAVGIPYSGFDSWTRLSSAIARVNYSYGNRLSATLNARYDGTSKLNTYRYGVFPGISVAYNLHNEEFFDKINPGQVISSFKPRVSWGTNGSIDPLGDFAATPQYTSLGIYSGIGGFGATSLVNTDLKWERAQTFNFGFDLGLFKNKLVFIGDFFIRNVYDKLTSLPIPAWTGFTSYTTNLGQLQNKGFELEVRYNAIRSTTANGFNWDIGANVSHVKSYAIELPDNGQPLNRQSTTQVYDPASGQVIHVGGLQEGKRIGLDEVWAPIYDGIYRSKEELDAASKLVNSYLPHVNKRIKMLGDARWRDLDKNDTIDFRDMVYVGRTTPTVVGGFNTSLSYKGFSLFVQADYALGFTIVNQSWLRGMSQVQGSQNGPVDIKNTWSPANPNGSLPRYYWANYNRNYFRDAGGSTTAPANFWNKGDYLMLREVTLSYDVPATWLRTSLNNFVQNARVYFTGSNLHYFTNYSGTFPETGGNDVGRFPLPRTLTMGINVTF
jgi:TonB-linked SusC/RagA family outer membrane protein